MDIHEPAIHIDDILLLKDDSFTSDNVCIVTGAGAGIGRATAIAASVNGLMVVGLGRSCGPRFYFPGSFSRTFATAKTAQAPSQHGLHSCPYMHCQQAGLQHHEIWSEGIDPEHRR